jgi:aminoglycoside phosphotransferase (APT) family kinase protein
MRPLSSHAAIRETVGQVLGTGSMRVLAWHVRRPNYVVATVETVHPTLYLVVKLEYPGERPQRRLEVMASLTELVRTRTPVPTAEVVAVDVSQDHWPWQYLIVTHLPGVTWGELYPRLDDPARRVAQWQIGAVAAHLHMLRFDAFGQLRADGTVEDGTTALPALAPRLHRRVRNPHWQAFFLEVLAHRSGAFEGTLPASLCHEDLNPHNVLFDIRDGQPVLSGVLDFESAWAGLGESDLARLELWRLTAGPAVGDGYREVATLPAAYASRRPLLQLLWCLEYAEEHTTAQHQSDTDQVCRSLGVPPFASRSRSSGWSRPCGP